ncbi:hypothetical protein V6N13_123177 [Hibiscus sabdariffa]
MTKGMSRIETTGPALAEISAGIQVRSSMEPLGSFLPALNALLQHRRVSIRGYGYRYQDWVSILKNLTGILELVLHITGYRYSRVGIDTHLGYRYSIGVSVLKNHSGILECFKNVTGYRYS